VGDDLGSRVKALAAAYLAPAQRQLADGIGGKFDPVIGLYYDRAFATINADDLVTASLEGIEDAAVKALPIVGSLDQVTDLTPVLVDPFGSQRMMTALLG
jgi:hypothetical protein